jgi:hypothetical protein
MSEATFYAKIKFATNQEAMNALPKIKAFLEEGIEAFEWWQQNKTNEAIFWKGFETKFPNISDYLKTQTKAWGENCNSALSGCLDFNFEYIERPKSSREVRFSGLVWHFADWDPLCIYLKTKFNAVEALWISDEYVDPFDAF